MNELNDEEEDAAPGENVEAAALAVLARVVTTIIAIALGLFGLVWWSRRGSRDNPSLEEILASGAGSAQPVEDPYAISEEGMEAINSSPWPDTLPGVDKVVAYEELKRAALEQSDGADLDLEERGRLRHALMDRCQAHVAWLLRLQRERRSIERLSRRGIISQSDYKRFAKFADELDAEVTAVQEEAAWLCDDETKAAEAPDDVWRIAVQLWQQRRQQQLQEAKVKAEQEQLKAKERDEGRKAKERAADAKRSLKGLKGGFLGSAKSGTTKKGSTRSTNGDGKKQEAINSSSQDDDEPPYKTADWPAELPCTAARHRYERLKKQSLAETGEVAEGPARQRLRQALMERCQHHVRFVRFIEAEQARAREALERSKWRSGAGAPSSEDLGKIQTMDALAKQEMELVQAEADWLGDPSGEPGMGDRIWQHAFDFERQMRLRHQERDKQQRIAADKVMKVYAAREAKPWPKHLPGAKQRTDYENAKGSALRGLSQSAQRAMLEGRPAQYVIGPEATKRLRAALVQRAMQCVPIIQRLQAEAAGVKLAAERGHVEDDDLENFQRIEAAVNQELESVKAEADWLAESGTRKMGDSIWPQAFKVHAERRQAVLAKLRQQQEHSDNAH